MTMIKRNTSKELKMQTSTTDLHGLTRMEQAFLRLLRFRDRLARYRRYAKQIRNAGQELTPAPELLAIKERIWRKVLARVKQPPLDFRHGQWTAGSVRNN